MFGNGDPFGSQFPGRGQDDDVTAGDRLVGRIMSAEYNLAVQRNDGLQATDILARMLGQWLSNRFGR
jgi:hypothetical protein